MTGSLPLGVALLVLVAAFFHAGWNAGVKAGSDRLVMLALMNGVGAGLGLLLLPFLTPPEVPAWPYILASIILHTGYYFFLIQQYRVGDLSHVYPLARGLSPLLIAFGGVFIAGEVFSGAALLGLVLASVGTMSLAFETGLPWRQEDPRPLLFAFGTACFIAAYSLVDGVGVRLAGNPMSYIAWLFFLDGIPIVCFALWRRRREMVVAIRRDWPRGLVGGAMQAAAYSIVIWAMSQGPMAQVSALRESSVVFAVLIGVLVLKERFGFYRLSASLLVAGGLIFLNISS